MPEKSIAVSSNTKTAKTRPQWDKAEKRFIASTLLLIGLLFGTLLWWGRINELPDYKIPSPALPSPNAFDTYLQATFLMAPVIKPAVDPIIDGEEITDPKEQAKRYSLARRDAWLQQNAGAFATLRQGLKQQYQQPAARSYSAVFPYYARYRELARRLVIESKTHQMHGNFGAASSSALDTMQFGIQVPRGGSLIAMLVGAAIETIGRHQLSDVLPQLNAAECKNAARRLEKIRAQLWPFRETVREVKWGDQASLLELMKQPDWEQQITAGFTGNPTNIVALWRLRFTGKRRVMDNYTDFMDKSIAETSKPYAQMRDVPVPDDAVSQIFVSGFVNSRFNATRTEGGSALVLVALALRAYKLEQGIYPDKLDTLMPNYLQKIPADPFGNGENLRYKKQGATYKLWSIGPDSKDNGGAPLQQSAYSSYYGSSRKSSRYKDDLRDQSAQGDWVIHP